MLQCNMHLIATMRSKMEYVQEEDGDGNSRVRKLGLKPVQREGMEYEFTVFLDIDDNHTAVASKDRTGLLDGKTFKVNVQVGRDLMNWLDSGSDEEPVVLADNRTLADVKREVAQLVKANPEKDYKNLVFAKHGNPNELNLEDLKIVLEEMKKV